MSQDNVTTAEQVVEAKLKEATGYDVKFSEFDDLTEMRLKIAFKSFGKLITEITQIETINNREDRRNPDKVEAIIDGVKSLKNSLMYGLAVGIDNVVDLPKFKNESEAVAAGILAQLLDLRNLQLAANMRKEEKVINTNSKTGEENV